MKYFKNLSSFLIKYAIVACVMAISILGIRLFLEQKAKIDLVSKLLRAWADGDYTGACEYWSDDTDRDRDECTLYNVRSYKICGIMGGIVTARVKSTTFLGEPLDIDWKFFVCKPKGSDSWKICNMLDPSDLDPHYGLPHMKPSKYNLHSRVWKPES